MTDYTNLPERLAVSAGDQECLYADAKAAIEDMQVRLAEAEDANKALRVRLGSELERAKELVADLQVERSFLLSERASREKQEPVAWYIDGEDGREYNGTPKMSDGRIGTPLYAAPPVAAPARLTDSQINDASGDGILDCLCDPYDKDESGDSYSSIPHDLRRFARAIESAVLRANGFKVEGEQ